MRVTLLIIDILLIIRWHSIMHPILLSMHYIWMLAILLIVLQHFHDILLEYNNHSPLQREQNIQLLHSSHVIIREHLTEDWTYILLEMHFLHRQHLHSVY